MTQVADKTTHLSNFTQFREVPGGSPSWLEARRKAGIDRFDFIGFPTTR
ncbi:MAG: hypothetical protein JWL69_2053, partial [Phycisphaerales bacterium]|nr:hypothetical protein [Phycisphaerales bacterium]